MKKLVLMGLFLIILASCSSSTVENNNLITKNGILTKIEMSTWMYGSYILSDESGKPIVALKENENIEFEKYNWKKVEVKGELIEGYPLDGGPEYLSVKSIKLSE